MATMVTSTRAVTKKETALGGGSRFPGPNGNGSGGNGHKRKDDSPHHFSPSASRVMMWVLLAAIVMMFAALSSAYIVLSGGDQWKPIKMPRMFFLSTGILAASSAALEIAKRRLHGQRWSGYVRWLGLTLFLGLCFIATQLLGWRELKAQGVYLAGNPHSAFFYLFTGVHGAHLLGGVLAMCVLLWRSWSTRNARTVRARTSASVVSLYWHAMDGLWAWLFVLLLVWS